MLNWFRSKLVLFSLSTLLLFPNLNFSQENKSQNYTLELLREKNRINIDGEFVDSVLPFEVELQNSNKVLKILHWIDTHAIFPVDDGLVDGMILKQDDQNYLRANAKTLLELDFFQKSIDDLNIPLEESVIHSWVLQIFEHDYGIDKLLQLKEATQTEKELLKLIYFVSINDSWAKQETDLGRPNELKFYSPVEFTALNSLKECVNQCSLDELFYTRTPRLEDGRYILRNRLTLLNLVTNTGAIYGIRNSDKTLSLIKGLANDPDMTTFLLIESDKADGELDGKIKTPKRKRKSKKQFKKILENYQKQSQALVDYVRLFYKLSESIIGRDHAQTILSLYSNNFPDAAFMLNELIMIELSSKSHIHYENLSSLKKVFDSDKAKNIYLVFDPRTGEYLDAKWCITPNAPAIQELVKKAQITDKDPIKKAEKLVNYIVSLVKTDALHVQTEKESDYWTLPQDFLSKKYSGSCGELATVLASALLHLGFTEDQVFAANGTFLGPRTIIYIDSVSKERTITTKYVKQGHAWVQLNYNGETFILDPKTDLMDHLIEGEPTNYDLHVLFNHKEVIPKK